MAILISYSDKAYDSHRYFTFLDNKKINAKLPDVSKEVLESQCQDIKNLYYLCVMIVTGVVNPALENMSLPVLHNAEKPEKK